MNEDVVAERMLARARADGQSAERVLPGDDAAAIRVAVRRTARRERVRIRTGLVDGAVVVVLADAPLWHEPAAVMRERLAVRD